MCEILKPTIFRTSTSRLSICLVKLGGGAVQAPASLFARKRQIASYVYPIYPFHVQLWSSQRVPSIITRFFMTQGSHNLTSLQIYIATVNCITGRGKDVLVHVQHMHVSRAVLCMFFSPKPNDQHFIDALERVNKKDLTPS